MCLLYIKYCRAYSVATIIRRVLDWQLDLLDHTQLHAITVYTLYNSQQLSLFSSSDDFGSNSATTAATSSHGVPCHHSLTLLTNCHWLTEDTSYIASGPHPKENTSTLLCRTRPRRKQQLFPLLRCLATVINNVSIVGCWPTACMSQYIMLCVIYVLS
jgi:hypothetical protein